MSQLQGISWDDRQLPGSGLVDALVYNGVDGLAARQAHMRALTMARQAAERQYTRSMGRVAAAPSDVMRANVVQLQAELARIEAGHRTWLRAQGMDLPERRTRRTKPTQH